MNPPHRTDSSERARLAFPAALLALLLFTALVYAGGLSGPLLMDDLWNLQPLAEEGGIDSWASLREFVFDNDSGPTGRPVAMLSFALDASNWPVSVARLKTTNLILHLLCGLTLFVLVRQLARYLDADRHLSGMVALGVTALWLLQPLNVSTTLYLIQRMTQLMTLFTLLALLCFVQGRLMLASRPGRARVLLVACLFPFGLLAVLSKENGALLLIAVLVLEFTLFRVLARPAIYRLWLLAGVAAPLLLLLLYLFWTAPGTLQNYDIRHFSLLERLLTEARILLDYLWQILLPSLQSGRLFYDDYPVSTGLFSPPVTLTSVILVLLLLGAGWRLRQTQPVFSFAVGWYFGLHLLESTYIPLELYFEHRNYLPMIGPLIALIWYWFRFIQKARQPLVKRTAQGLLLVLIVVHAGITSGLTRLWGDEARLLATWAQDQPRSLRAQLSYSAFLQNRGFPDQALERSMAALPHYPGEVSLRLFIWNQACTLELTPPFSLQEIAALPDLEHKREDLNSHLRQLLENLFSENCPQVETEDAVVLFQRIGELPLTDHKRAGYHFYFSEIFTALGQLDPALIQLSRSFELNPSPAIPIRQALLSASAGNFQDALVFLERARQADNKRNLLLPSSAAEISRLRDAFQQRLETD